MLLQIYWKSLLIFSTLFLVYYRINTLSVIRTPDSPGKEMKTKMKEIVAYSLMKQVEIEGQEYFCDQFDFEDEKLHRAWRNRDEHWRRVEGTEVYISTVNFDDRLEPYHYLRIIGVVKGSSNETIYCQIETSGGQVRVIRSTVMPIWYEQWDANDNNTYFNPILISCRLPVLPKSINPAKVALTITPCRPPNNNEFYQIFKIKRGISTNFTVCVKPLNFEHDLLKHLVQWIEICKILGAEQFHIFVGKVTNNTRMILEWYNSTYSSIFHVENFRPIKEESLKSERNSFFQNTWQRRRYEVVAYNNCFYKNLNSKYIVPLDVDELIVPKTVKNWQRIVQNLENFASLIVQNVYFFKNRSTKGIFFDENRRSKIGSKEGENGKSFISTRNALTVFNHYSLHLLRPGIIRDYFLPFKDVQLNHYKDSCNPVIFPECFKYLSSSKIIDDVIFKYRDRFNRRYRDVVGKIKKSGIIF